MTITNKEKEESINCKKGKKSLKSKNTWRLILTLNYKDPVRTAQ